MKSQEMGGEMYYPHLQKSMPTGPYSGFLSGPSRNEKMFNMPYMDPSMYMHNLPYWPQPYHFPAQHPFYMYPDVYKFPRNESVSKPLDHAEVVPLRSRESSVPSRKRSCESPADITPKKKKVKNGRRVCIVGDCTKFAQGGTHKCIAHGGGKRCGRPKCSKSAYGTTKFCISHGGGKRCNFPKCTKSSQGSTNRCKAHGGGRRCKKEGCKKSAQGSSFCKAHGGGKRCIVDGCTKLARGKPYFSCCVTHGRQLLLRQEQS